jgi:hypothetical protein
VIRNENLQPLQRLVVAAEKPLKRLTGDSGPVTPG